MWGTGRGLSDDILRSHGIEVETIHDWRDVMFGGRAPEPNEPLGELRDLVLKKGCFWAWRRMEMRNRFGVIDLHGTFITPNQLIAILF